MSVPRVTPWLTWGGDETWAGLFAQALLNLASGASWPGASPGCLCPSTGLVGGWLCPSPARLPACLPRKHAFTVLSATRPASLGRQWAHSAATLPKEEPPGLLPHPRGLAALRSRATPGQEQLLLAPQPWAHLLQAALCPNYGGLISWVG